MRFTTLLVLFGAVVALLSTSETTLQKLRLFVDAFISIADETFFVLLCTYCVVPLLVYHMHSLLLREDGPDNERHRKQLESAHWKQNQESSNVGHDANHISEGDFSYGFFANCSFAVIGIIIMLQIVKELFGFNVSSFFNFASTLSVGIGFAFNETINNIISGTVTQMSLGIRHGDEVVAGDNSTWYVNEVGTLGVTISQRRVSSRQERSDMQKRKSSNAPVGGGGKAAAAAAEAAAVVAQAEAEERDGSMSAKDIFYIQRFVGHTQFANAFSRVSGPHPHR